MGIAKRMLPLGWAADGLIVVEEGPGVLTQPGFRSSTAAPAIREAYLTGIFNDEIVRDDGGKCYPIESVVGVL